MAHPTNFQIPLQAFRMANTALLLVSSLELALSLCSESKSKGLSLIYPDLPLARDISCIGAE